MKTLEESIQSSVLVTQLSKVKQFISQSRNVDKFLREVWDQGGEEGDKEDFYVNGTMNDTVEDRQRGYQSVLEYVEYYLTEVDSRMKYDELVEKIAESMDAADLELDSEFETYIEEVTINLWEKLFRHTLEDEL